METVDKVREDRQLEGVDIWIKNKCRGTLFYATGVGKTHTALLAIDRIERQRKPMYLILVNSQEVLNQWKDQIVVRYTKECQSRIILKTLHSFLSENLNYDVEVFIVDEAHEYLTEDRIKAINGTLVRYKAILALTASADKKGYSRIAQFAPIIDIITEEEAKEKGFIAEFVEYNIALSLTADEQKRYDYYTEVISNDLPKFNNDISLAQRCLSGGIDPKSKLYYSADNWALGLAVKKGWRTNLDFRFENHIELDRLWNPKNIIGYALKLMKAIRFRREILIHAESKYNATVALLDKFNKVKTIVFSEATSFADNLFLRVEQKHKAVVYHSKLKTLIRQSEKSNKPIKIGATRRKKEAIEAIVSGKARVAITSKALDTGFNVNDLRMSITASGTQNPQQYKQRGGRVKRKELNIFDDCTVLLVNLYIKDSQDEKWLKNRQKNALHRIYNVSSVDEVTYTPASNTEFELDI